MKKILTVITILIAMPFWMNAQTYSALWKQVKDAEQKDLPRTEQEVLQKIAAKAEQEGQLGQLLKALLQEARSLCSVAPDSLGSVVERLKQREAEAAGDQPLQAIWQTVLGYIYQQNRWLDELHHEEIGQEYYAKAVARPGVLAQVKATDYEPLVVKGADSRYFGDDLLSLICWQTERFDVARDYYLKNGNRRATLLATIRLLAQQAPDEMESLNKSRHIQRLDSAIAEYSDLPECGELVCDRYEYMDENTDATTEQKWQYINYALERWGAWPRMNRLRNAQRDLTALQYNLELPECVDYPHHDQTLKLTSLRGISELTVRIFRANVDGDTRLQPDNSSDYKKLKPLLTPLPDRTLTRKYVGKRPYELFDDSVLLRGLPVGVYMLEAESQPATHTARMLLRVSDVRVLAQVLPDNDAAGAGGQLMRIAVVNATTGQPVKGAKVTVHRGYETSWETLTSGPDGECTLKLPKGNNRYQLRATTDKDRACPLMNQWGGFYAGSDGFPRRSTAVYTDRAIYRPGQTVHAAAIVYTTKNGRDHQAKAGEEVIFELRDANWKMIGEQHAATDDFGTATAQFTLPAQGLTGRFSITVNHERHEFRVEEYKRPAFEVDIPQVSQNYEDGDTVVARGTARSYAGVPVQGAKVKYKVVRRLSYWWMNYSSYWGYGFFGTDHADETMAEGETVTDDKGQFTADMPMVLPKTRYPMFYNFVLTADVTDQAGETHQGTMALPLGNRKTAFSVTLPEKVLSEADVKVAFHQQNAAGVDLNALVRYRFDGGRWQEVRTNELVAIPQLKSGRHTLQAMTVPDRAGTAAAADTLKQEFTVFSLDDRKPAVDSRSWFFTSHERFPTDGGPVTVQAGSSDKNVHVLYNVISGNKVLENGTADLSNELINRKLTYQEDYGHGVLITYAWMKDGIAYTYATTIERPLPDKHLSMKWDTFRNRLEPGQQEEWTVAISRPDGSPADAQLMATLYDKSLDQLAPHSWSLAPGVWIPTPSTSWWNGSWGSASRNGYKHQGRLSVPWLNFNHIDTGVFPSYFYYRPVRRMTRNVAMASGAIMLEEAPMMAVSEADAADEESPQKSIRRSGAVMKTSATDGKGEEEGPQEAPVQMRENLQETAFFMPQLVCDSAGRVSMKFTLPESLTTWHFLGVAHTRDMMFGQMSDEAVARKEVMIQPNMPRFLRLDDKATISARVMNMSDKAVNGTAKLQLIDPETEKVLHEQKQQLTVADSSTVGVTFHVSPSQVAPQSSLLIVRMSIATPNHSDGEQHYLPILPSTERVTVTVPFTQNGPGTKEIDLKQLVPVDDAQSKLTVEYTNNPAWLLIQALPTVAHPDDDCAICQASAYYANSIGRHILQQVPTAKHVFEQWSHEQGDETSLMSNLQKDQQLKDLVLNETPWVMDADREQEQKARLADFFDQNTMDQRIGQALEKLNKLQRGDGSWSWWPDMPGSVYMTTAVTEMLVRLNLMTSLQEETKAMLKGAFSFLGKDIVETVEKMKKEEKKGNKQFFPSHHALQWLYICALDGRELPAKVAEANSYLKNLLKKETASQTIYEKALTAIVLQNKTYIRCLKEWTVYKEDMGRYYDTQRAAYSWRDYKIPTQVAAIEALKRLTPEDTTTISEMQRWLLQQKRTQAWDTPLNSTDAIYAFLEGNSLSLAPQQKTTLSIDGKQLQTSDATAGIGYVKTAMGAQGLKTFKAEKTSKGTSWGAVYAQFTQPTGDISDQQSGISVKREMLADSQLRVGDRIKIRITIEAERDYDFVQLKDKRAACLEPVKQLSGYNWREGYYCTPKDYTTNYYFEMLPKGRHIIETEYYVDREGTYETGTCTVQCAYSPEFRGTTKSMTVEVMSGK